MPSRSLGWAKVTSSKLQTVQATSAHSRSFHNHFHVRLINFANSSIHFPVILYRLFFSHDNPSVFIHLNLLKERMEVIVRFNRDSDHHAIIVFDWVGKRRAKNVEYHWRVTSFVYPRYTRENPLRVAGQ